MLNYLDHVFPMVTLSGFRIACYALFIYFIGYSVGRSGYDGDKGEPDASRTSKRVE